MRYISTDDLIISGDKSPRMRVFAARVSGEMAIYWRPPEAEERER